MQELKRLKPGDAPRTGPLSATNWNRVVSATEFTEQLRRSKLNAKTGLLFPDASRVRVKNSSGGDRGRFDILGIDDSVFTPTTNLDLFQNSVYFDGVTPQVPDHSGKFLILCHPIRSGKIGWAWCQGVCAVQVDFDYTDQPYADVKDNDNGLLQGDEGGAAQVLWKVSGTGTQWAIVRLGVPALSTSIIRGVLDGDLVVGNSATLSVWDGGTLADTGRDVTVYDWWLATGKKIAGGTKISAVKVGGNWYMEVAAACPVST